MRREEGLAPVCNGLRQYVLEGVPDEHTSVRCRGGGAAASVRVRAQLVHNWRRRTGRSVARDFDLVLRFVIAATLQAVGGPASGTEIT